jgi:hypothetical protein
VEKFCIFPLQKITRHTSTPPSTLADTELHGKATPNRTAEQRRAERQKFVQIAQNKLFIFVQNTVDESRII